MRTDRITQVLARYIGLGLLAFVGFVYGTLSGGEDLPEGAKEPILEGAGLIAVGLVGVGGLLLDQLIHKINNGGFFAAPKRGGKVSPQEAKGG